MRSVNSPKKIKKLLVANRGEIALRIMRSARELGIATVAVYSEADRQALHVRYADEAICIGTASSAESYLRTDKILEACQITGADAIHPGYGFLSENAAFARAVVEAGLIFVGPSPESIELMGSKLAAKEAARRMGVPLVPGTAAALQDVEEGKRIARDIGYPVLIKASAGGGGKGMRIVRNEQEFAEQMERAISEAFSAFGDGAVFIEKYIASPKHIEIQVLGDQHGNLVYLFERECSIQRRHQKVIEEAPSPVVDPAMRKAMGEAALQVARACQYYSAGTVEFIVDEQRNFYFLEMNTRLQVEHPVTEMITGIDLVKEQIRIAEGHPLSFRQEDLSIHGHAIEVRVYAEDPKNNFLPNVGKLTHYERPHGPGIRVDDAFESGMNIPIYYDPMIAKLIAHGRDRKEAIERMLRAIEEYRISGIATTLSFCAFALQHPAFRDGSFDTHFVERYFHASALQNNTDDITMQAAALMAAYFWAKPANKHKAHSQPSYTYTKSNWKNKRLM